MMSVCWLKIRQLMNQIQAFFFMKTGATKAYKELKFEQPENTFRVTQLIRSFK